ncbi:MAG: hypothetical protein ABIF09_16490 [Gemmatimonadota bacterium]
MRRVSSSPRILRFGLSILFWLSSAFLLAPAEASAQGDAGCDVPSHAGMVMNTLSNETRMFNFRFPTIRCPGGVMIRADSAVVFESTNYNNLMGNVVFWDVDSRLTADRAQYFSAERRLTAQDNAVLTDLTEGSVIRGDLMTLVRAGPEGGEDLLTVSGRRPHATLYPTRQAVPSVVPTDTAAQGPPALIPDSAATPRDSVAPPPDSTLSPPDSSTLPPDSSILLPDSAISVGEELPSPLPPVMRTIPEAGPARETNRVPYEIDAQRFILEGTRFFRAAGSVVVTRDSLKAVADSLEYDQEAGALFLTGRARVTTAQTNLAADAIRLDIPQDEVRGAVATGEAVLDGEDLRLLAPIVNLFFTEGRIERLMARRDAVADSIAAEMAEGAEGEEVLRRGAPHPAATELGLEGFPRRPYALAQDFILEGDSVVVLAPGEVIEEVWAMGNARGESIGRDSMNTPETLPLIARDWLEGDTIVAFFGKKGVSLPDTDEPLLVEDPDVVGADTAGADYQLKQLVARVRARSMYRMVPSDSTLAAEGNQLAIHYVIGDEITILLNPEGEAERMEVVGQTRGIHLEPIPRRGQPIDTVAVPDTSGISRGRQGQGRAGSGVGAIRTGGGSGG